MKMRSLRSILALSMVAAMAVVAPGGGASAGGNVPDAGPPQDYRQIKGLSQPKYETIRESYEVEMKDGIMMYVEVVRPKNPGKYGTILELSPYHGTIADRDGTRILPGPKDKDGKSIGLTGYFAPRGYAVVMADLRGTGRSEGCLDQMGKLDRQDAYRIVEWAAKQKWSNGKVGMTGHSYVGSTPMMAASQSPPHLTTIVPSAGLAAFYHHEFQDGVPYHFQWGGAGFAYQTLALARYGPPGTQLPVLEYDMGDNFGNDPQFFGCGATSSAFTTHEAFFSGAETDYHRERDFRKASTNADIPVFMVHGVADNAARIAAMDWYHARNGRPGDKTWIGQWDHGATAPNRPNTRTCPNQSACKNDQWTLALHAWFDKHLLGRKVETGPATEIFLNGGKVMTSPSWPPTTSTLKLYTGADGVLSPKVLEGEGSASYIADNRGFATELSTGHVAFQTAPFKQDTAIVGVPKMHLVTSVTSPRIHINATMYDSDGTTLTRIGRAGWAISPELRDGIDKPQPVIPTEKMAMDLVAQAQAYVIPKGHSLVIRFASSHPDKTPAFAQGSQVSIYYGGKDSTSVTLPVVYNPKVYADPLGPTGAS